MPEAAPWIRGRSAGRAHEPNRPGGPVRPNRPRTAVTGGKLTSPSLRRRNPGPQLRRTLEGGTPKTHRLACSSGPVLGCPPRSPSSGRGEQAFDAMDRFDKFTERARKVLTLAQEEAQRFNHNYIGTEHLLLGLVREGDGVAAKVLDNLGVELNKVRSAVEFIIGRGDRSGHGRDWPDAARQEGDRAGRRRGAAARTTTTSAPSTCCSASSARARASPPASSSRSASSWTRCAREVIRVLSQSQRRVAAGAAARQQDPDHRPARHRPDGRRARRQARPGHRPRAARSSG